MKLFRISNILVLALACALGGALFWTSQSVQEKQDALATLMAQTQRENESLNVLSAEWDYLNRPQRLEELARDYLRVRAPDEDHIVADAAIIPEPVIPAVPPMKPAIIPAMIKAPVRKAPPAPVIHRNDSKKFETLLQNLSGGAQ